MSIDFSKLTPSTEHGRSAFIPAVLRIHPFAATAVASVDLLLFSGELATGGLLSVLSGLLGLLMILPVAFIQHYSSYKDGWLLALLKGVALAVILAVPTPICSAITVALGAMGGVEPRPRARREEQGDDRPNVIDIRS